MFKVNLGRLIGRIETISFNVELPSVVNTAQPTLLIATEEKRSSSMRAKLIQNTDPALSIAKANQSLP
jgi:hypothetical protein